MSDAGKDSPRIKSLSAGGEDQASESSLAARCGFCGKDQAEAGRLLQGERGGCICVSCLISVNAELVENERQP